MLEHLITLDQELLLALNGSDSLFVDGLMWTCTKTFTWVPLLAGIIYVLFKNRRPADCLVIIVSAILLVVITDQFASGLCKPYFHRFRPSHTPSLMAMVDIVHGHRGGLYGFISSHAANTFGAAMFFTLLFRHAPSGILLFAWAMLSSYTRIYLGLHFPMDILCGALWGLIAGTGMWYACCKICSKPASHDNYATSLHTSSGYQRSSFTVLFLMAAICMCYAMIRAVAIEV